MPNDPLDMNDLDDEIQISAIPASVEVKGALMPSTKADWKKLMSKFGLMIANFDPLAVGIFICTTLVTSFVCAFHV